MSRCRAMGYALCAALLATPRSALASPDSFGLGDGHAGVLSVTRAETAVNLYALLARDAFAGDSALALVDTAGFAAGDLVMLFRPAGLDPATAPSGAPGPIDLAATPVGAFEFARVVRVDPPNTLVLSAPLERGFAAAFTQAVRVPEYTDVTIATGASVVPARAWDGRVGGIVVLLATGTVTVEGALHADGAGFRGGVFVNEPDYNHVGCTELDSLTPGTSGGKGEGLVSAWYGPAFNARGNVANGGGGGNCKNAGGAGGGHGGTGGAGGRSYMDGDRLVGGIGGAVVAYSLLERLTFGGGGGAGHGNDRAACDGGAGGGVVFVRARALAGRGVISADGAAGRVPNMYNLPLGHDASGGGGAGGAVYIRVAERAACGAVRARGGAGRDAPIYAHGPGGGGAGGRVLLQSAEGSACPVDVSAGVAGVQTDPMAVDGLHYGATPATSDDPVVRGAVEAPPAGGYAVAAGDAGTGTMPTRGCQCDARRRPPRSPGGALAWLLAAGLFARAARRRPYGRAPPGPTYSRINHCAIPCRRT